MQPRNLPSVTTRQLTRSDDAAGHLPLRAALAPVGPLESLLVERFLATLDRVDEAAPDHRLAPLLDAIRAARSLRGPGLDAPVAARSDEPPATPRGEPWAGRLVLDAEISTDSPVVRGTWVTVGQVVSLVVDGWSWADILRAHPELDVDDIRACLSYCVEEDGAMFEQPDAS
jgi:uncharacterized protein (DUF433 family)